MITKRTLPQPHDLVDIETRAPWILFMLLTPLVVPCAVNANAFRAVITASDINVGFDTTVIPDLGDGVGAKQTCEKRQFHCGRDREWGIGWA